MATGLVNPFGPSGPEGDALLAATQVTGDMHHAKGSTLEVEAKASKAVYRLPAGPLAIAFGAEARREELENRYAPFVTSGDISQSTDLQSAAGSRSVQALFVEASIPIARGLEAQVAARYDHYSDFGNTVNPKFGVALAAGQIAAPSNLMGDRISRSAAVRPVHAALARLHIPAVRPGALSRY